MLPFAAGLGLVVVPGVGQFIGTAANHTALTRVSIPVAARTENCYHRLVDVAHDRSCRTEWQCARRQGAH